MDSSLAGGDNEAQAGLEESVRNDSLPPPPVPVELLPEPNSKPLNFENFYQSAILNCGNTISAKYSLDRAQSLNTLAVQRQMELKYLTEMA
jgi:hypothetical protein